MDYSHMGLGYKKRFNDTHHLYFSYPHTDVKINSHTHLVDFNTLISAVGGGLGLFLGISVIDTLFTLYNWFFRIN